MERYAGAILKRLAARGHEVDVQAFTCGGVEASHDGSRHAIRRGRAKPTRTHVVQEDSRFQVTLRRPAARLGNTPLHPSFATELRDAIARRRPDVVLAHTPVPFPAEMAYRVARQAGIPFVATYHAGRLRGSSPVLGALAALDRHTAERSMLAGSDRLVAVTPYVRDNALRRHRDRVTIIPPGVDHDRYRPEGGAKDPAGILFVGPLDRSYRWKGVDVLWEAFALVRRAHPEATLTLVGRGDRHAEFAAHAATDSSVRVRGRLSEAEIIQEYRKATVLALPSTTDAESFGMVLAEANACGTPVVASRVGGIPFFVRDGDNGWLAPPGDARQLADRLLHVIDHPDEARLLARRGRRRVEAEHDWDDLAVRTEAVLAQAVAEPHIRSRRGRRPSRPGSVD